MIKIGVLGGGISGLSTAFFILKKNPKASVTLFEGSSIGGWIQTVNKDGVFSEAGPRSFRVSERTVPLLSICEEIGLGSKIVVSKTSSTDSEIFTGEKLEKIAPSGSFRLLKLLFFFPRYRKFIINNFLLNRRNQVTENYEDLSIKELTETVYRFSSEDERKFIVDILLDGFVQGVYSGDITKLSGRFCYPFNNVFNKNVLKIKPEKLDKKIFGSSQWVNQFIIDAMKKRVSAMTFEDGMQALPKGLFQFLENCPGFSYVPEFVDKLEYKDWSVLAQTSSSSFKLDHIISTIPSTKLAPIIQDSCPELSKICLQIPHNSLKTLSVGFEKLDLKGVGFLIPSIYQQGLNGVLYDSYSFPHLSPRVSLMGSKDTSNEKMLEIFRKITGCHEQVSWINENVCSNGLPQYLKGHLSVINNVEKISPSWLTVSGQSFYLSGVPNCIIRAKELILGNSKFI